MTRQVLDQVLRAGPGREREWDEVTPTVLRRGWGVRVSPHVLEEEMNPITVLRMFGQQAVAKAIYKALRNTKQAGFDALKIRLEESVTACTDYSAQELADSLAAALFGIK